MQNQKKNRRVESTRDELTRLCNISVMMGSETKENVQINFGGLKRFHEFFSTLHGNDKYYDSSLIWISDLSSLFKQSGNSLDNGNVLFFIF